MPREKMATKKYGIGPSDEYNDITEILTLIDDLETGMGRKAQWVTAELRKMRFTLKRIQSGV